MIVVTEYCITSGTILEMSNNMPIWISSAEYEKLSVYMRGKRHLYRNMTFVTDIRTVTAQGTL